MLEGIHVELPQMLAAREKRFCLQQELLQKHHCPLISFCLNIPGPVKTNSKLSALFVAGLQAISDSLAKAQLNPIASHETHASTGDEALLVVDASPALLKELMTKIEESNPLGRLFDIDVLDRDGNKLSRTTPRRCLLCNEQAQACARSRRHSVEELTNYIAEILETKPLLSLGKR